MEHKRIQQRTFHKKFSLEINQRDNSQQFEHFELLDLQAMHYAHAGKRLWTVLDCDGKLYLMAGWYFVNRLHYVITNEPYDKLYECRW
jgi:hypothetical protein